MEQHQSARVVVVLQHRPDHAPEDMQPMAENVGFVIMPLRFPTRHTLQDHVFREVQVDGNVQLLTEVRQQIVQKPSLACGARKTVQNRSVARREMPKTLLHHGVDILVRHQLAILHELAGQQSQSRSIGGFLSEDIAQGDGMKTQAIHHRMNQGSFAGTRGTKQGNVHNAVSFLLEGPRPGPRRLSRRVRIFEPRRSRQIRTFENSPGTGWPVDAPSHRRHRHPPRWCGAGAPPSEPRAPR
jgi:hypothetical protein